MTDYYLDGFCKAAEEAGVNPVVLAKQASLLTLPGQIIRAISAAKAVSTGARVGVTNIPRIVKHYGTNGGSLRNNLGTIIERRINAAELLAKRRAVSAANAKATKALSPYMAANENPALEAVEFSRGAQKWRPTRFSQYVRNPSSAEYIPAAGAERISTKELLSNQGPSTIDRITTENALVENGTPFDRLRNSPLFRRVFTRGRPRSVEELLSAANRRLSLRAERAGVSNGPVTLGKKILAYQI